MNGISFLTMYVDSLKIYIHKKHLNKCCQEQSFNNSYFQASPIFVKQCFMGHEDQGIPRQPTIHNIVTKHSSEGGALYCTVPCIQNSAPRHQSPDTNINPPQLHCIKPRGPPEWEAIVFFFFSLLFRRLLSEH